YVAERCDTNEVCTDGVCVDSGLLCSPGANVGCEDADSYRICDDTGSDWDVLDCPAETPNCLGSGECSAGICLPGQTRCAFDAETDAVERCADDGQSWVLEE